MAYLDPDLHRAKTARNREFAAAELERRRIPFQRFTADHWRVERWDYWPGTGVWIERGAPARGRGLFNLLRAMGK